MKIFPYLSASDKIFRIGASHSGWRPLVFEGQTALGWFLVMHWGENPIRQSWSRQKLDSNFKNSWIMIVERSKWLQISFKCIWMFRKARTHSLANKIQKYMKPRELNVDSKKIQESDELGESQVWAAYIDAFIKFLSNNLNENHMRTLLKSLESKGGITTECVIVPSQSEPEKKVGLDSLKSRSDVLVCKVLRWPDVESKSELKALISCQNYGGTLSCANPYHYSRIAKQGKEICLFSVIIACTSSLQQSNRDRHITTAFEIVITCFNNAFGKNSLLSYVQFTMVDIFWLNFQVGILHLFLLLHMLIMKRGVCFVLSSVRLGP